MKLKARLSVPAAVIPIYGTTLADMLGYTLMIPLLPGLASRYHASAFIASTLISVPAFCSMFSAPVWGRISDRIGRKSIMLISLGVTLVGYVMLALAHSLFWVFLARIISGLGAGNLSAAQSYIADVTEEKQRDQAFALYGAVFGAAFVIGPVTATLLMHRGVQFPFYLAALLEALNIALVLLLIPWNIGKHKKETPLEKIAREALHPPILWLLLRQFFFITGVMYFLSGFALYLHVTLHASVKQVGWMLAGAGILGGAVQGVAVAPLAARSGERFVAQIGFVLLLAGYALLYFVHAMALFVVVVALWAVGAAMVEPAIMASLSLKISKRERGALLGLSDSVNSVALIVGPAISGAVLDANARLVGVLPALATVAALFIGFGKAAAAPRPRRREEAR
jgi:DHA1 family tetracycline resistance protein-like MFS transporter